MKGIEMGKSVNEAGCAALMSIMTGSVDTNLIARSDIYTQRQIVNEVGAILQENPYPEKDVLETLDQQFIQKNLSPGGSADLLAICYLLYFLRSE